MSTCRCCDGISVETPAVVGNRPGRRAIAYRTGTHAQFLATLLARLSTARLADGTAPLQALTTRDEEDFTIALLDGFACVCDVLTFYQERIANEQYLRTARELFSVVELARLVDYSLRPGVAASTDIAFTVEEAQGALGQALGVGTTAQVAPSPPLRTVIEVGTKVQSVPGPGEEPQTFETVRRIVARPAWNALRPLLRQGQRITPGMQTLFVQGTATSLKPGDHMLLVAGDERAVRRVYAVTPDETARTTRIDFVESPAEEPAHDHLPDLPAADPEKFLKPQPLRTQWVERQVLGRDWNASDLSAVIAAQRWDRHMIAATVRRKLARQLTAPTGRAYALRQRAGVFGYNAPFFPSLPDSLRKVYANWEGRGSLRKIPNDQKKRRLLYLDNVYPSILPGSWVVLRNPEGSADDAFLLVDNNAETARSAFTLTGKVSRLTVHYASGPRALTERTSIALAAQTPIALAASMSVATMQVLLPGVAAEEARFPMRTTTVLAQSERLEPAGVPLSSPVRGNRIVLDGFHLGLEAGQRVIVTGERDDLEGAIVSEARTLKEVTVEGGLTVLTFHRGLEHEYRRDTVQINANVAPATHGETVQEAMGSGSGSQPFQKYVLRQPPLTYVAAANESGAASTLEVSVNDVRWRERPTLFGHGPRERIFATRLDDQGRTTVVFGDGRTGARLPSGRENVRAVYRRGSGSAGNLEAHRLTQLLTRPLGLKGATNPVPATGGADRERLRDARRNAPLTVRTLGRVVSLQDYEDFARGFAGIAKALATWTWNGSVRGVFLTLAGDDGAEVETGSELKANLMEALREAGDPAVPLTVASYRPRFFRITASLRAAPGHRAPDLLEAVTRRLRTVFSFERRDFGQPVSRSEVIAAMQEVDGVAAVDLDDLRRSHAKGKLRRPVLRADEPEPGSGQPRGAELLTLDPRPLDLTVVK